MKCMILGFLACTAGLAFGEADLSENKVTFTAQRNTGSEIFYCGKVDSKEQGPFIVSVTGDTYVGTGPFNTITDSEGKFCGMLGGVRLSREKVIKATARPLH